ncbi:CLUMA_CG013642, isoform A [Clunio marinus]|uniref:CLUMA_CG013642, isoform A n=1 Tax=Clunio marinus TaxID=568069 RepID=A0A1J1IMQ5_9DIPT|nr:CLUMA_CG013642, isoform A [Clunio marinus]
MCGKLALTLSLLLFISFFAFCACDVDITSQPEKVSSTKRMRFTRRSTTPTTSVATSTITVDDEKTSLSSDDTLSSVAENLIKSTDERNSNETLESIESSIVTASPPAPSIYVEISTKKSLRVRNCGERIGDDIPFIAILVHTNPHEGNTTRKRRTLSKGVLISERFVLATVSSIYHSEPFWIVSSVRLGDFVTWNKYANRDKSVSIEIDVDEIFMHKKKDLGLIKLKEVVTFTDIIRPACLPLSDNYNFKELHSHLCKRSQHNKAPADVSLEFAAPLSSFDCRQFFSRKHIAISKQEFCVWDETGDDCAGDIGNALFTTHNGRLFLVGLRSYAETNDDYVDPDEYPGVYVKVGAFLDWISSIYAFEDKIKS